MEEAEQLCDRVAIVDQGRIVEMDCRQRLSTVLKHIAIEFGPPGAEVDQMCGRCREWECRLDSGKVTLCF